MARTYITFDKKAYDRAYYLRHRREHAAKAIAWYEANRQRVIETSRARYLRYRADPKFVEKARARGRAYAVAHRASRTERDGDARRENRAKVIELLGTVCCRCGFADPRALQVDHINGGGRKEFRDNPHLKNPAALLKRLIDQPTSYQLLCANCNWIKRCERGEHQ